MCKSVKVKSWDELVELGDYMNSTGIHYVDLEICFTKEMAKFCGKTIRLDEGEYYGDWIFSPIMYDEVNIPIKETSSVKEICDYIGVLENVWWPATDGNNYKLDKYGNLIQEVEEDISTSTEKTVNHLLPNLLEGQLKPRWIPMTRDVYYTPDIMSDTFFSSDVWCGGWKSDQLKLKRGLVFRTKEEAIRAAKAMLETIKGWC